jgi:DNA-binding transcriptional regulator YdaS (Cro superfamily)
MGTPVRDVEGVGTVSVARAEAPPVQVRRFDSIVAACAAVGGQAAMARLLGVTPAAVGHWCSGVRQVPAERCPEIERATKGAVRCEELRPDVAWGVLGRCLHADPPCDPRLSALPEVPQREAA